MCQSTILVNTCHYFSTQVNTCQHESTPVHDTPHFVDKWVHFRRETALKAILGQKSTLTRLFCYALEIANLQGNIITNAVMSQIRHVSAHNCISHSLFQQKRGRKLCIKTYVQRWLCTPTLIQSTK